MKRSYFFRHPVQAGDKRRLRSRSPDCDRIPACTSTTLQRYAVFTFLPSWPRDISTGAAG